ncbi:xanthine dehydrogenase family protein molybdopterin-binding subunit [Falsiroseomonas oryziterrae]|uniref:xanthine dehydrogenase family protein molybdopterin-binding subunit n=1 Tax=Falsiroseomonas oryziterrae TaxID=2911368 RepID=UPI001F3218AB|nr:xanthine dehydrogenase family protein molybdopterin-binding subunit [Roseomonas sp. NPKOSM-4]
MAFDVLPGLGAPLRRLEDPRLLTGGGRYAADLAPPGALHAVFLRSPHAHARLLRVEAGAARAMPGVAAVITAAETAAAGLGPIPTLTEIHDAAGRRHAEPPRLPINPDRVRHVGEIVAMVVADTLAAARDAAEAIEVDYEPLPAVVLPEDALAPGAPLLHEDAPGNLVCDWRKGDAEAVERAFAAAAHVTRVSARHPRILAGYIEPRAALAEVEGEVVTLTTPSQGVHVLHRTLSEILRWPRERLRVVTQDVGGGFGPKLPPYPEQALACLAAWQLRRPVLWVQERTEHHLADTHARDLLAELSLALDAEGRFTAVKVEAVANFGAWVSPVNPTIPTGGMAKVLTGLYDIPAACIAMRCAFTNTVPVDAVRGAGKPETFALLEAAVDQAARETGRGPAALRQINLVRAFPHRTPLGYVYDSGDYGGLLEAALREGDTAGFPLRRAASVRRGRLRGHGLSCHLHGSGGWGDETSIIQVLPDGTIEARTGTQSQGQGHATAFAQVVAAAFGTTPDRVRILQGDSATIPRGGGTGGSSSTIVSSTTLARAAEAAIEAGKDAAAELLEAARADIEWQDGAYAIAGTDRRIGLFEVAARSGAIEGRAEFDTTVVSWPAGVAVAEVEIDPETGAVTLDRFACAVDAGTVVNPMLLAGQLHGGFAAGIGGALMEAAHYDADGQLLSATLMDYAMPRAEDLPPFRHVLEGVPTPNNALGIKGVGELPTNGAAAAVANAVADALGGRAVELPATAEKVWRALHG